MKSFTQFLLGLTMMGLAASSVAEITPPDVLVKHTAEEVLEIVKKDKDIQAGDLKKTFALAEEKILPHFDFERISRLVLGKYWVRANKEQQENFQREFRSLLLRTYASALTKYRNQVIDYKPLRAQPGDSDVTVKTQILQPGGQPIGIDYSLEKLSDGWKVYDIVIEGVSLVTNYRSQFSDEVRQSGMDGLIQKLAEKNKGAGTDRKQG